MGSKRYEDDMTTIAKVFAKAFPAASVESDILKLVAIFCGIGLLLSACLELNGISLGELIF
jgi:hypothetical protein